MLLTEGLWTNLKKAGSKVASYLKKLAAKLYAKIKDMISAFYKKVFKKLIDNLKAFAYRDPLLRKTYSDGKEEGRIILQSL